MSALAGVLAVLVALWIYWDGERNRRREFERGLRQGVRQAEQAERARLRDEELPGIEKLLGTGGAERCVYAGARGDNLGEVQSRLERAGVRLAAACPPPPATSCPELWRTLLDLEGRVHFLRRQFAEARGKLEEAASLPPGDGLLAASLAWSILESDGDLARARTVVSQSGLQEEECLDATRGTIAFRGAQQAATEEERRRLLAEARRWNERALAKNGEFFLAHYNAGLVLGELGLHTAAIGHLTTAARLAPGDALCHDELSQLYLDENRLQEALAEAEAAWKLATSKPEDRTGIVIHYADVLLRQPDVAVADQRQPANPAAEAERVLREVSHVDSTAVHQLRATAFAQQGKRLPAAQELCRALWVAGDAREREDALALLAELEERSRARPGEEPAGRLASACLGR